MKKYASDNFNKLLKAAINKEAIKAAFNDPEKEKEILKIINKIK